MANPVLQKLPRHPKRVILQLRVDQFDDCLQSDFEEAIEKYLVVSGRSMSELRLGRHFIHIEPFQSDNVPHKYFHIVLDLEQSQGPVAFCTLPHELFHIRRAGKGMQLLKTNNPLIAENLLRKIRSYTDELYPWGRTRLKLSNLGVSILALQALEQRFKAITQGILSTLQPQAPLLR